jgi:dihydroneopterin aldolase
MIGTIGIEELRISCIIGIFPQERIQEQELILDLELDCAFSALVQQQRIEDTVDYAEVANWWESWIQEQKFLLLETLAEQASLEIFARYPQIQKLRFKIRKPAAIPKARAAVVSISRTNPLFSN